MLSQGMDGEAPTSTDDYGQILVTPEQVRLDEGACFLVLPVSSSTGTNSRLHPRRSTCDEVPGESIPDFMYAAVFGQPFERQG